MKSIKNLFQALTSTLRGRIAAAVAVFTAAMVGGLAFASGGASAAPPTLPADPLGGAMGDTSDDIITWVTTYAVPAIIVVTVFGIIIRLGMKYLRRLGRA